MSDAEAAVLHALERVCPPDWHVLHSLWLKDHPFKAHAEVDFVVITDRAVVLLEVKGGTVWREHDLWHFQTKSGSHTDTSREGPFDQVRSAYYAIKGHLRDVGRLDLFHDNVWGYGVITPECRLAVPVTDTAIEPVLWMDLGTFPDGLREYLDRIAAVWKDHCLRLKRQHRIPESSLRSLLPPGMRDEIRDHIRPAIRPVRGLGIQAKAAENEIGKLTREQYRVFDTVAGNDRVLLLGAAGTGKTVLALEHALQLAEGLPRRRVLFVCFSRLLAADLDRRVRELPRQAEIDVGTYHQVVMGLLAGAGLDARPPEDWAEFNTRIEDLVLEALDRMPGREAVYDALVVDEAQDLMHPVFFQVLGLLLRGGLKDGRWLMCFDPAQTIFGEQYQQSLYDELVGRAVTARLTVNCRNSRQVAAYVNGLSGDGAIAVRGADGPEVLIQYYTDAAHYRRLLKSTVNTIVGDLDGGRIAPGNVVILTTERSFLPAELWEPGFFIRPVREAGPGASNVEVRVTTVHAFKGLEASCVVLVGLSELESPSSRRMMYVGGSRAKSVLRVLLPQTASTTVARSLPRIFEAIQQASRVTNLAIE